MPPKILNEFEKTWGEAVLSGGFTQIPNDLIRGIAQLKLTPYDFVVLLYICSVGNNFASAEFIADAQGTSVGTVRKSFRTLKKLGYVYFIYEYGAANRFNIKGLIQPIRKIALKRQRDSYQKYKGMVVLDTYPIRETYNNKDYINTKKDIKEVSGLNKCKETIQKIKEKNEKKSKPP